MRTDAAKNRQKIFRATSHLLEQSNGQRITMAQIAQKAGVGIGTLYRNFPTKGDLFIALAYAQLDEYLVAQEAMLQQKPINQQTIKQALRQYLDSRERRQRLLPTGSLESISRYYQRPNYRRLHQLFTTLIGHYDPHLDQQTISFRADMLISCLRADSYHLQRNARHLTPQQILDQLMALFFPKIK